MKNITDGVSVVIPVFNSGRTLPKLVKQISLILPELHENFELVLVNDGSQDNSWHIIEATCEKYGWVRGICLMCNYGQHNATLAGIRSVKYNVTITLDDDLQHAPNQIQKLINKLSDGFDVIYGTPKAEPHGVFRGIASRILKISLRHALGAQNAKKRGLPHVVCATTHTAKLIQGTLPAIGVFDVVEHIEDDVSFLKHLWDLLAPGGMLYLTVPAYKFLWSHEDDNAGHFHRYSLNQILDRVTHVGFKISYSTYIFQWLVFAVGLFRALPYRCGCRLNSKIKSAQFHKDHVLKKGFSFNLLSCLLNSELDKIANKLTLPFGGSCMLAARKELKSCK